MAIQLKIEVVQEILYEIYGGLPPEEATLSENFVLRRLNNEIAAYAYNQALVNGKLDGVISADDLFNITFSNISVALNTTWGLMSAQLPATPIGLPSVRAIQIFPSVGDITLFKGINRAQYNQMASLPRMNKVYYFIEDNAVLFDTKGMSPLYTLPPVNMTLTTPGALDMEVPINMSAEALKSIKMSLVPVLRQEAFGPQDNIADGVNVTENK